VKNRSKKGKNGGGGGGRLGLRAGEGFRSVSVGLQGRARKLQRGAAAMSLPPWFGEAVRGRDSNRIPNG